MSTLTVKVDDRAVREVLEALARRVSNLRPVMQTIGEDVMERAKHRFETGVGPDGRRWQPNARATIEAFIAGRGGYGKRGINKKGVTLAMNKRPLIDRGDLRRQFHVAATGNSVTIGNSMIYAAIQQFGGRAGRGKRVTIPARPYLPITDGGNLYPVEQQRILAAVNDYLVQRIAGT